jgi:hypothetical protein
VEFPFPSGTIERLYSNFLSMFLLGGVAGRERSIDRFPDIAPHLCSRHGPGENSLGQCVGGSRRQKGLCGRIIQLRLVAIGLPYPEQIKSGAGLGRICRDLGIAKGQFQVPNVQFGVVLTRLSHSNWRPCDSAVQFEGPHSTCQLAAREDEFLPFSFAV